MDDSEVEQARPLRDTLAEFSESLAALQQAVKRFALKVSEENLPLMSGDELEAAWWRLRAKYERLADAYFELAESAEDAMDLADAVEAREESRMLGGKPITHEELKAKLGFE